MAAAGGTRKGNKEDEMLAKAIALSLEGEEDKQVKKAIDLSLTETSKPVKPPSSLMGIKTFGTSKPVVGSAASCSGTTIYPVPGTPSKGYTMYTAQGDIFIDFYHDPDKILPKDQTQEPKALFGTITGLNTANTFGFIVASQPLPKEYKGKSLFFHFDVVKNLSEKKFKLQKGSKVKFVLYKGSFEKPKAFAVFLHEKYQVMDAKNGKKATPEASKDSKKKAGKDNNASALKNIKKQLKNKGPSKKVSVFWDIENCRPKRNTILEVVGKIRDLVLQGHQEQSFMVVCDVTEEPKDVISSLEDANVDVRHISRSKKNSSDEVLRQEMRKIVDTSNETGRIVLISGDCDLSKDLHGFRYRKDYEIVLIHNAMAKQALIQCANFAFPFETVLGQYQANGKEKKKKVEKVEKNKTKKEQEVFLTCKSGHMLARKQPDTSGWVCDASFEDGGCKRALSNGGNPSAKFHYLYCKDCEYYLCDLCGQARRKLAKPVKGKKSSKNAGKQTTKKEDGKKVQNLGKQQLLGKPSMTHEDLAQIIKDIVTNCLAKGDHKSIEAASKVVSNKFHEKTIGELVENLLIEILETNQKTRISGGNLLALLLKKNILDQSCLVQSGLNKIVENAADMFSVIPDFWNFLADIISPLFCSQTLPLGVLKDSKTILTEEMIGKYISSVLNQMGKSVGHLKVKKLWRDSDLDWADFVEKAKNIQPFVQVHKLEWLGLGRSVANFSSSVQDLSGIEFGMLGTSSSSSLVDVSSVVAFESDEDDTSTESEEESQCEADEEEEEEDLISF